MLSSCDVLTAGATGLRECALRLQRSVRACMSFFYISGEIIQIGET